MLRRWTKQENETRIVLCLDTISQLSTPHGNCSVCMKGLTWQTLHSIPGERTAASRVNSVGPRIPKQID
ncbi:hypothetical protein Pdw03_3372 [Penicillium digitatum]|uniref:Uncharacterized protein n=1 Tax=Penicillium digitatum TaxID=36651 RepID=A0A7T6XG53_PENDI|nr:hypothetical protein Pdw03_3285 [Penicillium digitatum]QQK40518.1 hypothetical protein Pdw03_3372 [Penicillium digitatum]